MIEKKIKFLEKELGIGAMASILFGENKYPERAYERMRNRAVAPNQGQLVILSSILGETVEEFVEKEVKEQDLLYARKGYDSLVINLTIGQVLISRAGTPFFRIEKFNKDTKVSEIFKL